MSQKLKDKIIDRLIAAALGLLIGAAMSFLWVFISSRLARGCFREDNVVGSLACDIAISGHYFLLFGIPLIGFIFGFDSMLKMLSKIWGTSK